MMSNVCIQDGNVPISFQSIEHLMDVKGKDQLRLELNAVHLWGTALDGSPRCLERCVLWLNKEERHRAARLMREEDRQRYVLAHGGLRAVLSHYLRVRPERVELYRSEAGKPCLAKECRGQPAITFNMSHADGRSLIAVSNGQEVGVDLERIRLDVEIAKLSERYFAPSEHATIMQSSHEQRAARFFRYWVAKEAVLKAQGVGLRALNQCEIIMAATGIDAEIRVPAYSPLEDNWRIRLLTCGTGWEAAVAARAMVGLTQYSLAQ